MKYFWTIISVFLSHSSLYSQGYDNTMIFGYGGETTPNNDDYGLNILTFSDGGLHISDNQTCPAFFNDTDAAISDKNGNLLFYFTGIDVFNKAHQIMENGDTLNSFNATGYDLPQGGIIIPHLSQVNKYYLFHAEEGYVFPWGLATVGIYYSVIDMNANNGLGRVSQRKIPVLIDTLEYGKLSVIRHGNGRDWWLIIGEAYENTFYKILINNSGIHVVGKQSIGNNRPFGLGQSSFSPSGNKYINMAATGSNGLYPIYLDIYNFDRCSGNFSDPEQFLIPDVSSIGGGISVSPNSKWLYLSLNDALYKFDLTKPQIQNTQELIAAYEPFLDPFPTKFFWMFSAPDDKIYIVTTSGSRTLHVIHKPDEPGKDCAFEQHGIRLRCYNNSSLPTAANYRLGPLDGSPCDNLGIDNDPVAWWRYEQDTAQHARFEFRDLSYHEPASWFWDFGDGQTSPERHPVHTFPGSSVYQVCLTVSNINGSDTHCKTVYSTVALKDNPDVLNAVVVGPNPVQNRIAISLIATLTKPAWLLFDQLGRPVRETGLEYGINEVDASGLPPGMYFWELRANGEWVKGGKMIKTRGQ